MDEELKDTLAKAKTRPMHFAFIAGKTRDGHCLLLDPLRPIQPRDLSEAAKAASLLVSNAFIGKTIPGDEVTFRVIEGRMSDDLAEKLTQCAKHEGVKLQIRVEFA